MTTKKEEEVATTVEGQLVPVMDLDQRLGGGGTALYWIDRLKGRPTQMWDGTWAVTAEVARRVVEACEAERFANERAHADYQAHLQQREVEVARVYREAYAKAVVEFRAQQRHLAEELDAGELGGTWAIGAYPTNWPDSPQTTSRARQAAHEEAERWERMHPAKTLDDFLGKKAKR